MNELFVYRIPTILTVAAVIALGGPPAGAVDPLVNPGFDVNVDGWSQLATGTGYIQRAQDLCEADYSIRVRVTPMFGSATVIQQLTGIAAGDELRFSGRYCEVTSFLRVGFFDGLGNQVAVQSISSTGPFTVEHTVGAMEADDLWVGIQADSVGDEGYMDDVSIVELAAGTPAPTDTPVPTSTPVVVPTRPYTGVGHFGAYE